MSSPSCVGVGISLLSSLNYITSGRQIAGVSISCQGTSHTDLNDWLFSSKRGIRAHSFQVSAFARSHCNATYNASGGENRPGKNLIRIVMPTPIDYFQMAGVRCPTCAANGQEVWVIPGKSCGHCGTAC